MLRHLILTLLFCAVVFSIGCGAQDPSGLEDFTGEVEGSRVLVDMLERAATAEVINEVTGVELGSPESESALISGWDPPEPHEPSGWMAWTISKSAVVELLLLDTAFDRLDLRTRPFVWEGGPDQVMTVVINGRKIKEITLESSMSDYSIPVPDGVLGIGTNRIELNFDWTAKPADHLPENTDRRTLAAAFQRLALGSASERPPVGSRPAAPHVGGDGLALEPGTGLRYRFLTPESAFLEFEVHGGAGTRLMVWLAGPDQPALSVVEVEPSSSLAEPMRLTIDWPAGEIVELSLAAVGSGGSENGIVVANPKVLGLSGGEEPLPNLLLIVVDTLRADYLGAYGADAETPTFDGLAARGVLFAKARSHIPITGPSHSSLFTSLLPMEHGVLNNAQELGDSFPVLAESMRNSGRQTAAIISLGVMQRQFGFDRGFDHYGDGFPRDWMKNAAEVTDEALALAEGALSNPYLLWAHYSDPHEPYAPANLAYPRIELQLDGEAFGVIDAGGRGNRFDLLLPPGASELDFIALDPEPGRSYRFDTFRLDDPAIEVEPIGKWRMREKRIGTPTYQSPLPATLRLTNPTGEMVSTRLLLTCKQRLGLPEIRQRYGQEVEYADREIGRLLDGLEAKGMMDNTLVVFVSDHGEGLGNHNHTGHVSQLYDSLLHVPMVFVWPGRLPEGLVIDEPVSLVDVYPTIAELLEVSGPEGTSGLSLTPLFRGEQITERGFLLATYPPESASSKRAIVLNDHKFIHSWSAKRDWVELYDLVNDPGELEDLAEINPEIVERLRAELQRRLADISEGSTVEADLTEEDKAQLRALGYLH